MADRFAQFDTGTDAPTVFYPVVRALMGLVFAGVESGLGSPSRPLSFPVIPKAAKVVINSYRQADSWDLTFDARDLPFDPQKLRLGTVEISMYTTQGIQSEKRLISRQYAESEDAASLSGRGYIDVQRAKQAQAAQTTAERKGAATETSRVFFEDNEPLIVGLFDDTGIHCSGDGRWATVSGQDYTALLMGRQWHPETGGRARRIPTGKRADDWAKAILREVDANGVLSVSVQGMADEELPVIGKGAISLHGRGIPVETQTSYWDVVYKTLTRHGLICYFRGYDLVITRPRTVEQIQNDVRYLAWGANLESIQLDRHLGMVKAPKIILQCQFEDEAFTVQYPDTGPGKKETVLKAKQGATTHIVQKFKAPTTAKKPSKKTPLIKETDEYQIHQVYGVSDKKILMEYARNLRYLIGHGERKVTFTTHHLCDLLGKPLLNLDVGDPVDIDWRDFNRDVLESMSPERRYQELLDLGYQPDVAQAIADSYQDLVGVQRPMRIHEMTYEWDCESGLQIEGSALDFVTDTPYGGPGEKQAQPKQSKLSKSLGRAH